MLARQAQIKREEIPEGWSLEAAAFINKVCICTKSNIVIEEEADGTTRSEWTQGGEGSSVAQGLPMD